MVQLEFWDDKGECVVGSAASGVGQPIPNVGDSADVPVPGNDGKYAYVEVTARQFYYGPKGDLIRVRLYCAAK